MSVVNGQLPFRGEFKPVRVVRPLGDPVLRGVRDELSRRPARRRPAHLLHERQAPDTPTRRVHVDRLPQLQRIAERSCRIGAGGVGSSSTAPIIVFVVVIPSHRNAPFALAVLRRTPYQLRDLPRSRAYPRTRQIRGTEQTLLR